MISQADSFFETKTKYPDTEKGMVYAYYPKTKALYVLLPLPINEAQVVHAVQFVLDHKDHLIDQLAKHNYLPQRMEVQHLVFDATQFAEQSDGATDWHDRILTSDDLRLCEIVNTVVPTRNPYYYASGVSVYWRHELVEPIVLIKDRTEEILAPVEHPELEAFLTSHPDVAWVQKGYHNGRAYHGYNELLTTPEQRRCYLCAILKKDTPKVVYHNNHEYYQPDDLLESVENVVLKAKNLLENLKTFEGVTVLLNLDRGSALFTIVVGEWTPKKATYQKIENGKITTIEL